MRIFGEAPYRRQNKKMQWLLLSVALIVVALGAIIGVLWVQNHHSKADTQASQNKAESQDVMDAVSKLYILPSGDSPTVAAITDISKLKGQEFFKNAQNGDYVLVYSKAKTAILYRKTVNKLVNVGPIDTGGNANNTQNTGQ